MDDCSAITYAQKGGRAWWLDVQTLTFLGSNPKSATFLLHYPGQVA